MYVCLCVGVTSHTVADAVADGACTTNDVAQKCGAGADCGRCRRSIRAIIESADPSVDSSGGPSVRRGRRPR
ncbi:(2Fe-2S)-binding protein [Mycolicibacterium confluentis]|uniref:(2Fe-2S)-binding protein n=1 Tax=Mycolicibacterium confluentis TaxID=28047 RepID=UPI000A15129D|nr:(2Fe-2S)-binding protein [Mycolicibacterium confluentis]MCV7322136.1 (2Fe-2S)-binding protein [Mycolicibacterium confluentis]